MFMYSAKPFAQADINGLLKVGRIEQTFSTKKRTVYSKKIRLSKLFRETNLAQQTFRERNRRTVRLWKQILFYRI